MMGSPSNPSSLARFLNGTARFVMWLVAREPLPELDEPPQTPTSKEAFPDLRWLIASDSLPSVAHCQRTRQHSAIHPLRWLLSADSLPEPEPSDQVGRRPANLLGWLLASESLEAVRHPKKNSAVEEG